MNQTVTRSRIESIDVLRGIVMIVMALDHVRDFFHIGAFQADPLDPATTTPALYFTRWITHLCAPTFVFLAGTSSYLVGGRKTKAQLSGFLIRRGLWLILAEVLVVTLALTFNPLYNLLILQVIWAIGISMVLLGVAVRLPYAVIFTIGLAIVLGHNLLDQPEAVRRAAEQPLGFWWDLLHAGRFSLYTWMPDHFVVIIYPFLPWTGLMLMGYCAGKWFTAGYPSVQRKKELLLTGLGLIVLFVVLRFVNGYGDPVPWVKQDSWGRNVYAFFNVNKYPPSLMYMSITIGISLIALRLLEDVRTPVTEFTRVFGRVPFFYYVLHFFLIHTLTVIVFFLSGYGAGDIVSNQVPFLFRPVSFGFPLWAVYIIWIGVILVLYPLCRRYNAYKSKHQRWWLSYL